ncbi:hypothetical protein E2I00_005220 [Balaenoptera physalus]|uniref:Ig-like domain-containing protein n=1 Tax=Balaenoptera physalus TaxID=9770 RepID=A0A643BTW4_BALPH|nr:hypothetical protein E2I00_005220 [Balaenoptera physalus]
MGEVVLWIPLGAAGQAWEAGLLSVGDEGSTLAPEQMGAGIQSDLVRDRARESPEVHWGVRPGKGSTADASRGILNGSLSNGGADSLTSGPVRPRQASPDKPAFEFGTRKLVDCPGLWLAVVLEPWMAPEPASGRTMVPLMPALVMLGLVAGAHGDSKPVFIKVPEDQTGLSGGVASFVCQATGEPKPRITWMKKGKKVSSQRFEVIEFDDGAGSVLRIQPLRVQRDEAIYECTATNSLGEINTSAKLSVLEGALQIESSEESDQGKYECVATNSAGTRYSAPANLYVRESSLPCSPRTGLTLDF